MYQITASRFVRISRAFRTVPVNQNFKVFKINVMLLTVAAVLSSLLLHAKTPATGAHYARAIQQTRSVLVQKIGKALLQKDAETQFFKVFNGGSGQPLVYWKARLAILANNPESALDVAITPLSNTQLKGAYGAFARKGVNGQPAIYLNREWLDRHASKQGLERVMAEEMGHAIDLYLNGDLETAGDEGEVFAHNLLNLPVSAEEARRMAEENDMESVVIEGKEIIVEDATVYFNHVYRNGSGTNYDLNSNTVSNITRLLGSGFRFISSNPNDAIYALNSGNNVSGTLTYVDPSGVVRSVSGGISRKEQGNPSRGFYFYVSATEVYWLVIPGNESAYNNGDAVTTSSDRQRMLADLNSMLNNQNNSPKITVNNTSATESSSGSFMTFTVTVNPGPTGGYSFSPTLNNGSATAGSDYTATMEFSVDGGATWSSPSASPTINATQSQTTVLIRVPIIDDNTLESQETFTLTTGAISGSNGILNNAGAYGEGTITDDDGLTPTITQSNISKTYGDADFTVSPQSNSNGNFNYAVTGNTGVVTVSNGTFSIVGAGTTQITITQDASGSYTSGTQTFNITVAKAPLTVTADNQSRQYGAVNPMFTATYAGFVYGQDINNSGVQGAPALTTTATTSSNAGPYAITATAGTLLSDNYSFSLVDGTLTVTKANLTFATAAQNKTYDGQTFTAGGGNFSITYTGFVNGDNASVVSGSPVFGGAATTATDAGTYAITATAGTLNATNYNFVAATSGNGDLTITSRTLTVSATASNKQYDGNNTAVATLSDDRVSGDVLTVSNTGATFSDANAGTGKTVSVAGLSLSGADAANYTLAATTATTTADITAAPVSVSVSPATKVYGAADPAFTPTITGLIGSDVLNGTLVRAPGTAVGTYAFSGLTNSNYAITYSTPNFSITPRTLTVSATASNKQYDGNNTAVATLSDDRVSGDVLTVSNTGATFSDANAGTGKTVSVAGLSLSGADAANYTLAATTATTTANITAIPATVNITPVSKMFGTTDPAFVYTTAGLLGNDQLSGTLTRLAGEALGTYAFSGLSNNNYLLTYAPAVFTISQAVLTISGQPQGAAYCQGGTLNLSVTVANAAGYQWFKDGVAISGATAATFTKNNITTADAGTYHVVVTGATGYGGTTSANATVTVSQTVTATITATGSAAYCPGSSVLLTANAGAVSYQWFRNGTAISGATARTYTATAAGSYTVTINMGTACGNTTSAAFVYAMDPAGDCDGDGIINSIECPASGLACPDTDGDGTEDYIDTDSDNDGISDNIEKGPAGNPVDTDGDGNYDYRDLDSDNDGISDTIEKGPTGTPVDTDGDGVADFRDLDSDNDGISDTIEKGPSPTPVDTDGDGNYDFRDLDTDNDGIADSIEKGATGTPVDTDGDGNYDYRDLDSDNDGITDAIERGPNATPRDTDGDGTPDFRDLDSDNDGITDAVEKGPGATPLDTDGDGTPDFRDLDSDNDGLTDTVEKGPGTTPLDTDGDGTPDFRDLDSDNDGITDAIEKGTGANPRDTDGDGTPDFRDLDSDNDGITDAVEKGTGTTPRDTDGDGTPDFQDLDSDNDGIPDATERGPNATPRDTDGDGTPDFQDLDSDNDGLTDTQERGTGTNPIDTDGDGVPDFRDTDSDNDGITDAVERGTGSQPLDTDGDGVPDYRDTDSDNDGISDRTERGPSAQPLDSDDDGVPDYRDTDSDNDGKTDDKEGGAEDCDGDGIPNFRDEQECLIDILVPDVFTPNGDGINDVIKPVLPGITQFKSFKVFNRWGNLLFETRETGKGWNGRYQGVLQPTETYLWFAEGVGKDGRQVIKRGTLSLLR